MIFDIPFEKEVISALKLLKDRLLTARPLLVEPALFDTWIIFTDGSCEAASRTSGIGGVLLDPKGRCVAFFSERVPKEFLDSLLEVSENPIYELELLPVLVSYRAWGSKMKGAQLVVYLDNDAARHSLIRGTAGTSKGAIILEHILNLEDQLGLKTWYARVPTHSNVADGPSRFACSEVRGLGASQCHVQASVLQP